MHNRSHRMKGEGKRQEKYLKKSWPKIAISDKKNIYTLKKLNKSQEG